MNKSALVLGLLFCAGYARAHSGRVTGRVFEKGTKNAVPTAEVMLLKTKFHTWTGLDGRFALEDVPAGSYELTAVGGGFLPSSTQSVRVLDGISSEITVLLDKPFFQGDEIVVKGERVKSVGQQGLTREEMKKIPGTFDDPLRGLQALPGVASPHDFSSTFLLRGGDQYDNQILIDGIPVDIPFHIGGLVSSIHPEAIKSADLYSGGYGPRFGNALGGAMEVATREPRRDRFAAKLNFNPILPDAILDVPLPGKGGLLIAGRRSYFDLLLRNVKGLTVAPLFQDGIVKVSYDLGERGVISVTGLGSSDGLAFHSEDSSGTERSRFFTHYEREALGWKWYWTDALKSDIVVYHGDDGLSSEDRSQHNGEAEKITLVDVKSGLFGARAELNVEWHPRLKTIVGGTYEDRKVRTTATFQDFVDELNHSAGLNRSDLSLDGAFRTGAAYVDQKIQLFEPLCVSLGGRVDQRDGRFAAVNVTTLTTSSSAGARSERHFSPRASFELALGENSKLRGAWGRYYQWPSLNTPPFQALGNAELHAESADHYVLGVEHQFPSSALFVRVEGFYKKMKDLIVDLNPDSDASPHEFITNQHNLQNSGKGWAKGGEFFIRKKIGSRFVGWGSYTYELSRRTLQPGASEIPATYDQNNILTLLGSYRFSRRTELSLKWHSHSGNPYTPQSITSLGNGGFTTTNGAPNSARLSSYQRLDMRLTKTSVKKTWTISYYFDLINVLNHKNLLRIRHFTRANQTGNGSTVTTEEEGQFPLIPFFGIRAEY